MPSDSPLPSALPPLREVITHYGLDARRGLGQHFLLDANLTGRIARTAGDLGGVNVIEIGPGPGGLTRSLLATAAARVIAIEKDSRCIAALQDLATAFPERLSIIEADALEVDCRELAPPPRAIVANLPYNVGTPLLLGWLRDASDYVGFTLMFQKEVAARLTALPGTSDYGRLSIVTRWQTEPHFQFTIDPRAFTPPPRVTSAVVTLTPRREPLAPASWIALQQVTAAAFGQRRKMLRSSLKALGIDPRDAGLDPTRRAEDLSVEEFCALARLLLTAD